MTKQDEFLALYEPEREKLERFVLFLVRNRNDAKDIISETLLIAYERFEMIRDRKAFLSFLFTIASRLHREWRRQARKLTPEEKIPEKIFSQQMSPEDSTDVQILLEALRSLPEKYSEAIILAEIMGFSHKEIREIQGGTVAGVKVRIFRARSMLRKILLPDERKNFSEENGLYPGVTL